MRIQLYGFGCLLDVEERLSNEVNVLRPPGRNRATLSCVALLPLHNQFSVQVPPPYECRGDVLNPSRQYVIWLELR